jgi:dolichol-phosphate mannosyltransferase
MPEYHKFIRGQVSWIGFRQEGVTYDVQKRLGGKPKYSYRSLYKLALDGIFTFGRYPLHLVMIFGLMVLTASLGYIVFLLAIWLLKILNIIHIPFPPGWTTIVMGILFLGSIQIMALGIVSEYVGRIYDQTKGRPVFIVREKETGRK